MRKTNQSTTTPNQVEASPRLLLWAVVMAMALLPTGITRTHAAPPGDAGTEVLQQYVLSTSAKIYQVLITRTFRKVESPSDEKLLSELATQISQAAGQGEYQYPVSIAVLPGNPAMINALTLPGGQIIFLKGILEVMRKRAEQMAAEEHKQDTEARQAATEFHYRRLVAAILGHEMGHYFGQHFLRQYNFKAKSLSATGSAVQASTVRYGQEHELESDEFSLQMMHRLGYNPSYLLEVLQILKSERERFVRAGAMQGNPYLESHPSGNERLAAVATNSQGREFFERMAGLERAFASIETGADLKLAGEVLDAELQRHPKNTLLLTAAAKIYHRRWEASCTVDELMFKAALAPMTFRDELINEKPMLSAPSGTTRRIPGDTQSFETARAYYARALAANADMLTRSSYAALLSYDPKQKFVALALAESSAKALPKSRRLEKSMALNNAGIAYYFNGDHHSAELSFKAAAGFLLGKKDFRSTMYIQKQKKIMEVMHGFSDRNVGKLYESYFNLGQLYHQTGHAGQAKTIWKSYLEELDWSSDWARYAAAQTGINLASIRPGPVPLIAGIGPGYSIPAIIREWGKPGRESSYMNYTRWVYPDRGADLTLLQGFAKRIKIRNPDAKVSNGAQIGLTRARVLELFGKPTLARGNHWYYPRRFTVLSFTDDKVSEVLLMN